jgi:hypothetical protein
MLWPIMMIGSIIVLEMLLLRGGRIETPAIWRRDASRQTPFSERFARDEIDGHEYKERKGLLSQP